MAPPAEQSSRKAGERRPPSKITLFLLATVTVAVVLCCGGGIFLLFNIKLIETDDPAQIDRIRARVMEIQLPEGYEPIRGIELDYVIYRCSIAMYQRQEGESQIALLTMDVSYGQSDLENARGQVQQQGAGFASEFDNPETEISNLNIAGEEIPVTWTRGTLKAGNDVPESLVGKSCYSIQVIVPREGGVILLSAFIPETEFQREELERALQTIVPNRHPDK